MMKQDEIINYQAWCEQFIWIWVHYIQNLIRATLNSKLTHRIDEGSWNDSSSRNVLPNTFTWPESTEKKFSDWTSAKYRYNTACMVL